MDNFFQKLIFYLSSRASDWQFAKLCDILFGNFFGIKFLLSAIGDLKVESSIVAKRVPAKILLLRCTKVLQIASLCSQWQKKAGAGDG